MSSDTPARRCCGCGSARADTTQASPERKDLKPMKLNIPDMSCGHCVQAITKAVKALDDKAEVTANLESKTVTIATSAAARAVSRALDEAGYPNTSL